MGFNALTSALFGTKKGKGGGLPGMNTAMDILRGITGKKGKNSSGGKPPVDNSHSHGSSGNTSAMAAGASITPVSNTPADLPEPGFMGKNKDISAMQFGEMTRGGDMVENPPVQTAGASPSSLRSSPADIPADIDQQGVNSLYSEGMAKIKMPKKSGTHKDDATYGIKATSGIKHLKK